MKVSSIDNISGKLPQDYSCTDHRIPVLTKTVNPFQSSDSSLVKKSNPVSANPFGEKSLNPIDAYNKARKDMLYFFKHDFCKSEKFKETFGKDAKWEDYADQVISRIELTRDKNTETEQYQNKAYAFKVDLGGLYGEIVLDKVSGEIKKISISAD